ncbi:MAG TPA: DUF4145 domain-containing protein [Terracidiphilus sp.]|jgi:hypothetical protein
MEQRLSDFLLEKVDLYGTDGSSLPSKHDRTITFYLEKIAKGLIGSREAFTDKEFSLFDSGSDLGPLDLEKGIQNDPETFEIEIDRVLSRQVLESVPAIVKRFARMSKLGALRVPSEQTGAYIREAARTYAYGFMQASAAMSRAALEQALKERLGCQGKDTFIPFQKLVNEARKRNILDDRTAPAMRDTAKKANSVLHAKPIGENDAFDVLIEARGLIQQIYDAHDTPEAL